MPQDQGGNGTHSINHDVSQRRCPTAYEALMEFIAGRVDDCEHERQPGGPRNTRGCQRSFGQNGEYPKDEGMRRLSKDPVQVRIWGDAER